jgi:Domain of unknown function (DUF4394)/Bacterial pre-peptidase C-terminal domain
MVTQRNSLTQNLGRLKDTKSVTGSVGQGDRFDVYQIRLTERSSLTSSLTGLTGGGADLELLNGDRQRLAQSKKPGRQTDSITQNLDAGTYFLRVKQSRSNQSSSYSLNATLNPLRLFGLTDQNNLIAFNADNTNAINVGSVTGLAAGEKLVGIDFRATIATLNGQSLNGTLYGVGSSNRLYKIDTATAQATQVGTAPFSPGLDGTSFGVDFNPAPDRLRVVSNNDQNLRLVPDGVTATAGTVADGDPNADGIQTDTALSYITGDTNFGRNPNIVETAYANNRPGGRTTQFGIDADLDILVRHGSPGGSAASPFGGSPNGGLLTSIGALGFDFGNTTAFDIFTDNNQADSAVATSGSTLYGINLATGAARNLGTVTVNGATVNVVGLSTRVV